MQMVKEWTKPMLVIQEFEPNEYVAACWSLACTVPGSDPIPSYDRYGKENNTHGSAGCGNPANQIISDNNGVLTVMENSADQGLLEARITSPTDWAEVYAGMVVTWETSSMDSTTGQMRTWHHSGTAQSVDSSHPNRS